MKSKATQNRVQTALKTFLFSYFYFSIVLKHILNCIYLYKINHLTLSPQINFINHRIRIHRTFVWFKGRQLVFETDYLSFVLLARYQGPLNLVKYIVE
jgi:hypothetical protein